MKYILFLFLVIASFGHTDAQTSYTEKEFPFKTSELRITKSGYVYTKVEKRRDTLNRRTVDASTTFYFIDFDLNPIKDMTKDGGWYIKHNDGKQLIFVHEIQNNRWKEFEWNFLITNELGDSLHGFSSNFKLNQTSIHPPAPSVIPIVNGQYLLSLYTTKRDGVRNTPEHDHLYLVDTNGKELAHYKISSLTTFQVRNHSAANLGKRAIKVFTLGVFKPKLKKYKDKNYHNAVVNSSEGIAIGDSTFLFESNVVVDISKVGFQTDELLVQMRNSGWMENQKYGSFPYYWIKPYNRSSTFMSGHYNLEQYQYTIADSMEIKGRFGYYRGIKMNNGNTIHLLFERQSKRTERRSVYTTRTPYDQFAMLTLDPGGEVISANQYKFKGRFFRRLYAYGLNDNGQLQFINKSFDKEGDLIYCLWRFDEKGNLMSKHELVKERDLKVF